MTAAATCTWGTCKLHLHRETSVIPVPALLSSNAGAEARSQWNPDSNPSTRKGSRTVAAGTGSQCLGRVLQNSVRVKIEDGPVQPQQKPKNSLQPLLQELKCLETATRSPEVSASSSFCTVIRKREKTIPRKTAKRNFHFQAKRTNH